jgi:hypothetical protein
MKFKIQNSKFKNANQKSKILNFTLLFWILIFGFCILSLGCDAFVRKFTRKPKKENLPERELVLAPEEYKGTQLTREELYRQYLLYWKSWQDELITSLSHGANHKKQIGCADEVIKNIKSLRALLNEERQKKLDIYIAQLESLKGSIAKDTYGNNIVNNRSTAERIKRNILRDFSFRQIKDYLAKG